MFVLEILATYFLVINIIGFVSMRMDKKRAQKKLWRIPEATLFMIALLGGSIGSILGMHVFHHKTRHWYFVYGMPAIFILQIATLFILIFYSPIQFYVL